MTSTPGPPNYPPHGAPTYGHRPRRSSSTPAVVTALLAVLFVAATALAAWGVHEHGTDASAGSGALGASGAPQQGGGVPAAGGASSDSTAGSNSAAGSDSTPSPIVTPSISSYVPPPVPTPTHQPLDPEAVNRTFQVYMNALLNRSLSQLKSATCPKLRHTETGTALDHKYINRWQGHDYTIENDLDYVIIAATVRYVNPNTGGNGNTHVYSWYVDRYPDGQYWVCGILE